MISLLHPRQENRIPDFPFGNLNIDYARIYLYIHSPGIPIIARLFLPRW